MSTKRTLAFAWCLALVLAAPSVTAAQKPVQSIVQELPSQAAKGFDVKQEIRPGWPYLSDFLVGSWAIEFEVGLQCPDGQTIRDLRYAVERGQHFDLSSQQADQVLLWDGKPLVTTRQQESRLETVKRPVDLSQECNPGQVLRQDRLVLQVEGRCTFTPHLLRRRYFLPMELRCLASGPDIYTPQIEDPGPPEVVAETYAEGTLFREVGVGSLGPLGDLPRRRDDRPGLGLTLGRTLGERSAVQATVSRQSIDVRSDFSGADGVPFLLAEVEQIDLDISYRYRLLSRRSWRVFAVSGGGYSFASVDASGSDLPTGAEVAGELGQDSFTLHGGLALHVDLRRRLYFSLDIQGRYLTERSKDPFLGRGSVGLGVRF